MVRGGTTGAGLPTDHGLAGDAQQFGQPGLGQIACGAEDQDLLTEIIVAIGIRGVAHGNLPSFTILAQQDDKR